MKVAQLFTTILLASLLLFSPAFGQRRHRRADTSNVQGRRVHSPARIRI